MKNPAKGTTIGMWIHPTRIVNGRQLVQYAPKVADGKGGFDVDLNRRVQASEPIVGGA